MKVGDHSFSSLMILTATKLLLGIVFLGWMLLWVMMPTNTYRNIWTPKIRTTTNSTYFGPQGFKSSMVFLFLIFFFSFLDFSRKNNMLMLARRDEHSGVHFPNPLHICCRMRLPPHDDEEEKPYGADVSLFPFLNSFSESGRRKEDGRWWWAQRFSWDQYFSNILRLIWLQRKIKLPTRVMEEACDRQGALGDLHCHGTGLLLDVSCHDRVGRLNVS